MSLTRTPDIEIAFVNALKGATAAANNVFDPRSWPTDQSLMPVILLKSPRERKESTGPHAPQFDVFTTITVIGRLTFKATPNDAAAAQALSALGAFQQQIEVAIINNLALFLIISEITSVDITSEVKSEGGQSYAELTMDFICKFYQGPEWFAQPVLTPMNELAAYGDLLNVYDPTGTYDPPMPDDPVTPPPRSIGPDGRVEIGAIIPIDQS